MYNNLEGFCDIHGITLHGMSKKTAHLQNSIGNAGISSFEKSAINLSLTLMVHTYSANN